MMRYKRWTDCMSDNVGSEYTREEVEFIMAMDCYKRERDRPFPDWCEVLAVAVGLGYRKVTNG